MSYQEKPIDQAFASWSESYRQEQKKYIYQDNRQPDRPVMFECVARDIEEADALYQQTTGQKPERQPFISCVIEQSKHE